MKVKKQGKKRNILLRVSVLIFIIYVAFLMIQQQITLKSKKEQLENIQQQVSIQQLKNDEIRTILKATDKENEQYIEKKARESLDYSFSDEQVFIGIAGN